MARNRPSGDNQRSNRKPSGDRRRPAKGFTQKRSSGSSGEEPTRRFSSSASLGFSKRSKSSDAESKSNRGDASKGRPFTKRTSFKSDDEGRSERKRFGGPRSQSSAGGRFSKSPRRSETKGEESGQEGFKRKPFAKRSFKSRDTHSGEGRSFVKAKIGSSSFSKATKVSKRNEPRKDGLTRLNKYIANSGVGSRREADELIKMGLVSVNGKTITEMGFKIKQGDVVRYEDKVLKAEKPVYILLNKPKGFITTTDDPQERNTVMNLVAKACKERIYPVGRLDRNTTGLLLLTNDGDLADKLTHPSYNMKKVYKVELNRPITKNDFQKIADGVHLEEGKAIVDDLAIVSDDKKTIGIELHIGWNRIVRRIFESLEYEVVKLDRVVYAGLDKKDLPRGNWRFLKQEEIVRLKHYK